MAASAYHIIPTEIKKYILIQNWIFRYTCCINNTHWQIIGIIIFWCNHYIVILDTLVGSFSDVLFLLLAVILSGLDEKPKRKKKYIKEFVRKASLFWLRTLLSISLFVAFFIYSLTLSKWCTCWMAPIKIHNIAMVGILSNEIMNERLKIWKSLAIRY